MTGPTVADELAFEALSDEVKALAKRVLWTKQDVMRAYEKGFDRALDKVGLRGLYEVDDDEVAQEVAR